VIPVPQQAPPGTGPVPTDARLAEAVRTAILQGDYAPRQRLIEADLCERYGTSRFIVRSALQELSAQGLVEFQRNRGARVREISLGEAIVIDALRALAAAR
jgi:DNA-binding GntR family transcriptional regulator